jgi:hypothetical protein
MALTRFLAAVAFVVATTTPALAQSVASEVSVTGGASTDEVTAGALQGRVFADTRWVRVFAEASWATVAGPHTDAFGAAYPYERRIEIMEAYGERSFRRNRALGAVRAGRFRTPFGIYSGSDHGYGGFLRAPLIRYPGYWALGNTFLEHGVNVMAGTPALQAEYTIGTPSDVGEDHEKRRAGADQVIRVQGYRGDLIVGASHIRTQPYQPSHYARGRAIFSGLDARWMRGGFQLRGEWLAGQPFDNMHTSGGYIDAFLHRREMGPVTAVARAEVLDYDAGARSVLARRATLGARILLADGLYAQVNATRQSGVPADRRTFADLALTYTIRVPR